MGWIHVCEPATGAGTVLDGLIGPVPDATVTPPDFDAFTRQAFLVGFDPGSEPLGVHFHPVDQFQMFVSGTARFGGHDVGIGTVHYADRLTPYGPLAAGPNGVAFLTLRSEATSGASFMPEQRDALADERRESSWPLHRNVAFELGDIEPASGLVDHRHDADGLRVATVSAGPASAIDPIGIAGDGAYVVILEGSLADGHGAGALRWIDPAQQCRLQAGPAGVTVAVLQLPDRHAVDAGLPAAPR